MRGCAVFPGKAGASPHPALRATPGSSPGGRLFPPRGKGSSLSHREREAAKRRGEGSLAQPYFITLQDARLSTAYAGRRPLAPPEQPVDVRELQFHVGRSAMVALAGARRRLHLAQKRVHLIGL